MINNIIFAQLAATGALFALGCIGEKDYNSKKLYAVMSCGVLALATICTVI